MLTNDARGGGKQKAGVLLAGFFLPAAVMTLIFALCGIAPFGTNSLGVMDMAHQYLGFFGCFRQVLSGELSPYYLPAMCLGVNLPGAMGYYIFSPLNLLFCLVDEAHMLEMASVIYILRVGLCGLTMSWYAGKKYGWTPKCLLAAVGYAFIGYMIANCINFLWHDCVILLPLIAAGLERLVAERKPWLYIISLAACIILCYYLGYMLCIFSVLWFFAEFLCREKKGGGWRTFGCFALASLAAGALSMIVMVPQLLAVSGGPQEFSLDILSWEPKYNLALLGSKIYTGAFHYNEITPSGLPNIFFGMAVFTLDVLYFFNRRISARRRIVSGALVLIFILSFWIHGLDVIWHCLNEPVWYNGRYSFIFNFLLLALAVREFFGEKDSHRLWHYAMPVAALLLLTAAVFGGGRTYLYLTPGQALACCAEVLVMSGLLCAAAKAGKAVAVKVLLAALLLMHTADMAVNAVEDLRALTIGIATDEAAYEDYSYAVEEALALRPASEYTERTESTVNFGSEHCEPMLYGYNGVSGYSSTIPTGSLQLLQNMGYTRYEDRWAVYGPGVSAAADSFLGVRYILGTEEENRGYGSIGSTDAFILYENKNALPAAFTVASLAEPDAENCFEYLNGLYSDALGGKTEIFVPAELVSVTAENAEAAEEAGLTRYAVSADAAGLPSVTWEIIAAEDGPLYAAWQTETNAYNSTMVFVNGERAAKKYLSTESNGSLCLGSFEKGETVAVTLQFGDELRLCGTAFYTERAGVLAASCDAIRSGGCGLREINSARYTGRFTAPEGVEYLLVTLAGDGGWRAWLDGEETEVVSAFGTLTAVRVTPGEHTVELKYTPPGLAAGSVITAVTLCLCVALYILRKKKSR